MSIQVIERGTATEGEAMHSKFWDFSRSIGELPEPHAFFVDGELVPSSAGEPVFTNAELIEIGAQGYDAWGNALGDLIARRVRQVAIDLELTGTVDPDLVDARIEAMQAERFRTLLA